MKPDINALKRIHVMLDHCCDEHGDTVLLPDGLEASFVGIDHNDGMPRGVFSREVAIETLMRVGEMNYEDAVEYWEFNVACAYVGEQTPLWISTKPWVKTP